jgi:outer membrane protease
MKSMKQCRLRMLSLFYIFAFFFIFVTNSAGMTSEKNEPVQLTKNLTMGIKVMRLENSHTSYEFGNPFSPYQAPLSRLEFPLDSWWGGVEMRLSYPRFSIGGEVLSNALGDAQGRFKDSDWDDDAVPDRKTIYSESSCRMEPSYMVRADVDLEVSDWLGMPQWFSLRPVVGFRYQNFHMVTHDGTQYEPFNGTPPLSLPGNGIRFKQTYWQYFTGIRSNIDIGRFTNISSLKLLMQFDWAYVEGSNEDNHLLRGGRRFTYENTYGYAWHASAGLKKGLSKNLSLGLEAEYLQITTTGNHRFINEPLGQYFGWSNGVKVWSEQTSISLTLDYRF